MEPATSKLFIAIPAPPAIAGVLNELRRRNEGLSGVRWVPGENLHITVYFLGFVEAVHIPAIMEVMNQCLEHKPEFTLHLNGISLEGARSGHPSMVWARFNRNEHFTRLANDLGQRLSPYITAPSKFTDPVPHITLARIKSGPLPDVSADTKCEIEFSGFELWRSVAVSWGVKYEKL